MSREIYRNEWKYLISWGEKELITSRIAPLLHPDPNAVNGGYLIRSLYFDDYWNTAYEEKDAAQYAEEAKALGLRQAPTLVAWGEVPTLYVGAAQIKAFLREYAQ